MTHAVRHLVRAAAALSHPALPPQHGLAAPLVAPGGGVALFASGRAQIKGPAGLARGRRAPDGGWWAQPRLTVVAPLLHVALDRGLLHHTLGRAPVPGRRVAALARQAPPRLGCRQRPPLLMGGACERSHPLPRARHLG
jgi:hypothetical protein